MKYANTIARISGAKKLLAYSRYLADFFRLKRQSSVEDRLYISWKDRYPCLNDSTASTGFDHHYVYHPAWAARILARTNPKKHVDISSSLHFCTIVSAFIPVEFYDYRPAALDLSGLSSASADLLALPFADSSVESLSCMHVVEHVGLGRYGDPLDAAGDLKAIKELTRVLACGGNLLFVVPIGRAKIRFNAHRIYSYEQVVSYFPGLRLRDFSLITDDDKGGKLINNADKAAADLQEYGCGCFWFEK